MGSIIALPLDLLPVAIPFEKVGNTSAGVKTNPTVATVRIFREDGGAGAFDNSEVSGSPFTCTIINAKVGNYGVKIAKSLFTAGKYYRALWEWTVDGNATSEEDTYFMYNTASYKANVTNLDAAVSSRATPAQVASELNTYDAVKRSEATSDKNEIIGEVDDNEIKIDAVKVDTAAIKLQTDLLPADPTSETLATANKAAIIAANENFSLNEK